MLYSEIIAVCSEIHTKHKICTELVDVAPGGTSVYLSQQFLPQISSGYLAAAAAAAGLRPPVPCLRRHNRAEPQQCTQRWLLILRGPQFVSRHRKLALLYSGEEL